MLQGQRHRQQNLLLLQLPLQEKPCQVSIKVGAFQHNTHLSAVRREPLFPSEHSTFLRGMSCNKRKSSTSKNKQKPDIGCLGKRRLVVMYGDA